MRQPEHLAQAIDTLEGRRLKRREQEQDARAHENIDRRPDERRRAGKERGSVCATQADRRVRTDLVRVRGGAHSLQHAPEGGRHFAVTRRKMPGLDVKQPVADQSGAPVHADDAPAPVEQDGADAQMIEPGLDPFPEHGASRRGDGANPFDMVAGPFEFGDLPILNFSRSSLDAAADFARHKLKADETPQLERIEKLALYALPIDPSPVQNHSLVNERRPSRMSGAPN